MSTIGPSTIERKRGGPIVLRAPEERDVPEWVAYELAMLGTDPHRVREPSEFDPDPAVQWARLREHIDEPGCLMIVACPADEPRRIIGDLTFRNGKLSKMAHQGHFGIAVAADHRGTGVGGAMIRALLDWGAAHPVIEKIALGVWATNTGAIRMYERHGFVEEGRRWKFFRTGPGEYVDDVQMAIWVKPGLAPWGFNTHPVTA